MTARVFTLLFIASTALASGSVAQAALEPHPRHEPSVVPPDLSTREKGLPALAWTPADGLRTALRAGTVTEAEYALFRAESLFGRRSLSARFGALTAAARLHATPILRDLAIRTSSLSGTLLARAQRVLARPTDGGGDPFGDGYSVAEEPPVCSSNACVHYVASTADAPDPTDVNTNGVPDYVDEASAIVEEVWQAEITTLGYRAPKSDLTSPNDGGDAKLDVYVKNIGSDGLYGYCTSDDPNVDDPSYLFWDVSAYCVIDDDFSAAEFPPPSANGIDALKVTVAHEFFHAVQFAYDWFEDVWILEGTATWMEEQVYDDIDDNRQYLPSSPLRRPSVPLDRGAGSGVYGNWIFWQFLTEYFADPSIVLEVWTYADGSASGPDAFSSQALALAIGDRSFDGTAWRFRWAFADFGAANAAPRAFYAEGQAGSYPTPAPSKSVRLSRSKQMLSRSGFLLDHMTNRFIVVKRGRGIGPAAKLKISLDGPNYGRGTEASAVVFRTSGVVSIVPLRVASDGDALKRVPFGKGKVAKVVIVLTNASSRFRNCWANSTPWSCSGVPRDDDMRFIVAARVA